MCDNIAWDVVLGICCSASGAFQKKKLICISHSHLPTFTVVHPFSSTLYHIQEDVITHLNNFILLAQGNISGALNDRSHHNGNERRRMRVPQDYQATSVLHPGSSCHSVFSCRVIPWPVALDRHATKKKCIAGFEPLFLLMTLCNYTPF
jgi:hypothetical protein